MPMSELHTGKNMLKHLEHLGTAMEPKFLARVVSISIDGASPVTGSERGIGFFLKERAVAPAIPSGAEPTDSTKCQGRL